MKSMSDLVPMLIGSRALNYWHNDCKIKDDADWDIISVNPIQGSEWHDSMILMNAEFAEEYRSGQFIDFNDQQIEVMLPTGLAVIKRSHLWRDLSFQKHITHYHRFLVKHLVNLKWDWVSRDLLVKRTFLTMKMFPQGSPNLMQSKKKFFDDAVTKKYNHDWLHDLFAYDNRPQYLKLLRNPDLAWCEKQKWDQLSKTEQLQAVAEEVYVIAAERFLIPCDWNYPGKRAYFQALDKVCTTLCSGWFRDFAIDHYPTIVEMFDQDKFDSARVVIEALDTMD